MYNVFSKWFNFKVNYALVAILDQLTVKEVHEDHVRNICAIFGFNSSGHNWWVSCNLKSQTDIKFKIDRQNGSPHKWYIPSTVPIYVEFENVPVLSKSRDRTHKNKIYMSMDTTEDVTLFLILWNLTDTTNITCSMFHCCLVSNQLSCCNYSTYVSICLQST